MKTKRLSIPFVLAAAIVLALGGAGFSLAARAQGQDGDARLAAEIDAVMSPVYTSDGPGAALIVRRGDTTVFRKGYGLANIELAVPIEPDMAFRIGSVTKQFTAVAILMLADEGKVDLSADVTTYLPSFPSHGRRITVEHLLTHTSGVKSYTNLPEWLGLWRKDLAVQEILDLSREKEPEFEPGQRWRYNNTGFVALGAIVEKASGKSYEAFLQERIFTPLRMASTGYDHTERLIPRRVSGYQKAMNAFVNAPYLSMTQPFAAGALYSTVDDLARWNDALLSGTVVKKTWLDRAFTPYPLADGESSGYGYGWFVSDLRGHRAVEHGGGINGFSCYTLSLPDDRIYVALLTNGSIEGRRPEAQALRIAELALGLPPFEVKPVKLSPADLVPLVGVYENADKESRSVTLEGEQLFTQRPAGPKVALVPASASEFFPVDSTVRFRFSRDASGEVDTLRVVSRIGPSQLWRRTNVKAKAAEMQAPAEQAEREAILAALNASAAEWNKGNLDGYMAVYWRSPDLTFSSGPNTTRGFQVALDRYKRNYQAPGREMGQLDYRDVRVDILGADTAFVRGFWHLAQSGGKEPHGVFTLLLRKFPEGWKIVHDHSSGE